MGKAAKAELPKLDEALTAPFGDSEARDGVSLDFPLGWHPLLGIVRDRIEPRPALDLRGGDIDTIKLALQLVASHYKLLQMEQALLEQYRGKTHTPVKMLSDEIEKMRGAFTIVYQLLFIRHLVIESPSDYAQDEIARPLAASEDKKSGRQLRRRICPKAWRSSPTRRA